MTEQLRKCALRNSLLFGWGTQFRAVIARWGDPSGSDGATFCSPFFFAATLLRRATRNSDGCSPIPRAIRPIETPVALFRIGAYGQDQYVSICADDGTGKRNRRTFGRKTHQATHFYTRTPFDAGRRRGGSKKGKPAR